MAMPIAESFCLSSISDVCRLIPLISFGILSDYLILNYTNTLSTVYGIYFALTGGIPDDQ